MRRAGKVCGVAVIEGSALAWSGVTGGAPDALFQAGSIAKPVTALAALELAARGQADLDADVNEQLTSWHLPGRHGVSLRQLLGHTAGIGVQPDTAAASRVGRQPSPPVCLSGY
jgi:CubicO group peptidase (beta-lactamase class C family)